MTATREVLLLENIHPVANEIFERHGYVVHTRSHSLSEDDLIEAVQGKALLGVRFNTNVTEKVLGNVIASGVKVLVLAVIVGIGSTLFSEFTASIPPGSTPTVDVALAIVLGSIALLGLGIYGPGIASGLVSGAPQLGAGAAAGAPL